MDSKEEILKRLRELEQVKTDAEALVNGFTSDFWKLLGSKIRTQQDYLEEECAEAAGRTDREIRAFIGKKESLRWVLKLPQESSDLLKNTHEEILSLQNQMKDLDTLDKEVENELGAPIYQPPAFT